MILGLSHQSGDGEGQTFILFHLSALESQACRI